MKEVKRRGFTMHYFGRNPREPELMAAVYRWPNGHADVVILRGKTDATAFRSDCAPNDDPFKPRIIHYLYNDTATWAMRAILTIGAPGTPTAPHDKQKAPKSCFIPDEIMKHDHTIVPPMQRVGGVRG